MYISNIVVPIGVLCVLSGCKNPVLKEDITGEETFRERLFLTDDWRFIKYDPAEEVDDPYL